MFDYKKSKIYLLRDNDYIYSIAITSTHPLFQKILKLCISYQKLNGLPYYIKEKIWSGKN